MTVILYAAKTKLTPDHQPIRVYFPSAGCKVPLPLPPGIVYIRVETDTSGAQLDVVLDRAKPRKGETVLNSIEL